jgi:hypothetical protein
MITRSIINTHLFKKIHIYLFIYLNTLIIYSFKYLNN